MENNKEPKKILKAKSVDDEASSWLDHIIKFKQETPKRLEEAAKFFTGIVSFTLTLLLSVNQKIFDFSNHKVLTLCAVFLWIISIGTSFFVVFPFDYRYSSLSSDSIVEAYEKMVKRKKSLLIFSLATYLISIGCIAFLLFLK